MISRSVTLGTDANADVWVSLGFFSFQPGELAKISLAIFFAGYLVRTRESLTSVGTRFLGLTWHLHRGSQRVLDRVEQPRSAQLVDPGQVAAAGEAEML